MALAAGSLALADRRAHRIDRRRPGRRRVLMLNPNVLYLAEHADERAAAVRHDLCRDRALSALDRCIARSRRLKPSCHRRRPGRRMSPPPAAGFAVPSNRSAAGRRHCRRLVAGGRLLSRYEAWPIAAAAVTWPGSCCSGGALPPRARCARVRGLALWPVWTVDSVSGEQQDHGRIVVRVERIFHPRQSGACITVAGVDPGLGRLGRGLRSRAALAGLRRRQLACCVVAIRSRRRALLLLLLALAAAAALPWSAYLEGHQVRLRYDVPLVAAAAAVSARRSRCCPAACAAIAAPLSLPSPCGRRRRSISSAAVIVESQRDVANSAGREAVTRLSARALGRAADHDEHGLARPLHARSVRRRLRDPRFPARGERRDLEGGGGPSAAVRQMDRRRGVRSRRRRALLAGKRDPDFFRGYVRVAEGGNVALYRRTADSEDAGIRH